MKIPTDLDPKPPPPSKNSGPEPPPPFKEFLDPPDHITISPSPQRSASPGRRVFTFWQESKVMKDITAGEPDYVGDYRTPDPKTRKRKRSFREHKHRTSSPITKQPRA